MSINSDLEKTIGHVFADKELLRLALTHASLQKHGYDNERLEFLGDRVLGLAVADVLYKAFPGEDEGHLAKRHTALVQKAAIAKAAEAMNLGAFLQVSSGELKTGGLKKDTILADALEALIGAVYLDGGLGAAEDFIEKYWTPLLHTQTAPPEDAKTTLQEWVQAQGLPLPAYKVLSKSGAEHAPRYEVEVLVEKHGSAVAIAASKRGAQKEAAKKMLEKIGVEI